MSAIDERLLSGLYAKDDLVLKLSDTLDVKASILLVVITFLGTQTAYFLDKHVAGVAHWLQAASVVLLTLATVAAIVELWPQDYILIAPETNVWERVEELRKHYSQYPDEEANVIKQLTEDEAKWARDRIEANDGKNRLKSQSLYLAFYLTAGTMVLNVITLIIIWTSTHPF